MKSVPRGDFPIRVRARPWEEPAELGRLYEGIYDVTLNSVVDIVFVPGPAFPGPPFDSSLLPWDLDSITTMEQARLAATVLARYVVTADGARAGAVAHFQRDVASEEPSEGVVFFVDPDLFDWFSDDLAALSRHYGSTYPAGSISDLHDRAVVAFIEDTVLASGRLADSDAAALGIDAR